MRCTTAAGGSGETNAASEIPNLAAREGCTQALAHTQTYTHAHGLTLPSHRQIT